MPWSETSSSRSISSSAPHLSHRPLVPRKFLPTTSKLKFAVRKFPDNLAEYNSVPFHQGLSHVVRSGKKWNCSSSPDSLLLFTAEVLFALQTPVAYRTYEKFRHSKHPAELELNRSRDFAAVFLQVEQLSINEYHQEIRTEQQREGKAID